MSETVNLPKRPASMPKPPVKPAPTAESQQKTVGQSQPKSVPSKPVQQRAEAKQNTPMQKVGQNPVVRPVTTQQNRPVQQSTTPNKKVDELNQKLKELDTKKETPETLVKIENAKRQKLYNILSIVGISVLVVSLIILIIVFDPVEKIIEVLN